MLRISTSVFVTNFPDKVSAKDLWNACKEYGQVVDSFIPNRRSKIGKRFGFVRFVKVFDVERLVGNLCTVWIGNFRLHANLARFIRPGVNKNFDNGPNKKKDSFEGVKKDNGVREKSISYAHIVKGRNSEHYEKEDNPALVLDDSCVNQQEFSCCVNGKVKEFGSLVNLKMALRNDGFSDIELRYLGGLWVMIVFTSVESKENFLAKVGTKSWFSQIVQASSDFAVDGRVTWVDIEGIPLKLWSDNTFKRVASKWGTLLYVESTEGGNCHCKRVCILTTGVINIFESFKIVFKGKVFWVRAKETSGWTPDFDEQSDDESESDNEKFEDVIKEDIGEYEEEELGEAEVSEVPDTVAEKEIPNADDDKEVNQSDDPFGIYSLLNKNKSKENNESDSMGSIKYPPGFTPREEGEYSDHNVNERLIFTSQVDKGNNVGEERNKNGQNRSKKDGLESVGSGQHFKVEIPKTGGSLLNVMEELIKLGQTMGYNMEGVMKDIEEIVEVQGVEEVFR